MIELVFDLRAGLDNTADALRTANAQLADARKALKQSRSVDNVPTKTKTNPNRTSANKADNHSCGGYRSFSGDTLVLDGRRQLQTDLQDQDRRLGHRHRPRDR